MYRSNLQSRSIDSFGGTTEDRIVACMASCVVVQCTMGQMEVLRDDSGREAVRFVTPSGVTAVVATCVSDAALDKFIRKLERKLKARAGNPHRKPASKTPMSVGPGGQHRRHTTK